MSTLTDPATLDTPALERAIISARFNADTDPRLEAWADKAVVILEQRRVIATPDVIANAVIAEAVRSSSNLELSELLDTLEVVFRVSADKRAVQLQSFKPL